MIRYKLAASILVIAMVLFSCVVHAEHGSGYDDDMVPVSITNSIGYDTPEEAATAFIAALQHCDVAGMFEPFAIDAYVEHYDPSLETSYNGGYSLTGMSQRSTRVLELLYEGDAELNRELRKANVAMMIREICASVCLVSPDRLEDGNIAEDKIDSSFFPAVEETFAQIRFDGEFVSPILLDLADIGSYDLTNSAHNAIIKQIRLGNVKRLLQEQARYGADDIRPLAALIYPPQGDGMPYSLSMDAVCYNGRWFLAAAPGVLWDRLINTPHVGFSVTPLYGQFGTANTAPDTWVKAALQYLQDEELKELISTLYDGVSSHYRMAFDDTLADDPAYEVWLEQQLDKIAKKLQRS